MCWGSMEMVVEVEGSEEGNIKDIAADKPVSGSASSKQVADPVVYKLVRVDFDGRFVPATDDELMEVENLLELEKNETFSVTDVMETVGHGSVKDNTSEKLLLEKRKEIKTEEDDEENIKAWLEDSLPTSAPSSNDREMNRFRNTGEESSSSPQDGSNKSGSAGSVPNFSLLKGEINLDKLTIRELHETFRATFGRKTSVKDKMWLKRRIAMGLTNSCDVSVTSFVINEGKLLKNKEELCENMDCEDSIAREVCNTGDDMSVGPVICPNIREDAVDDVELKNSLTESGCKSDDTLEHRATKRVRKPTKRYIEELSDKEMKDSCGKLTSASKHFGQDKASLRSAVRPACGVRSSAFVTRPDSIGGSGVQVPYVSRIRRCRPRKSIMALTKFHSSDVALTRKIVGSSVAASKHQLDEGNEVKTMEVDSVPFEELIASEEEREKRSSMSDIPQDREPKDGVDSGGYTSQNDAEGINFDDSAATVASTKGGMRRKHHRAWTLTEVVKLVDGVARFGAGRWSEIKRLYFSSYSYRTSVDLKDKWRNLLKASFANLPADKGMNPRKNGPSPIPAPILVKVRELAEINGQAPQVLRASCDNGVGSSVNENRSGYL